MTLVCVWPAFLQAASPTHELLRLVPENVGFCLVVQDLRGHGQALIDSPFLKQFRDSPLGVKLRSAPEATKFDAIDQFLKESFRVTSLQLRDEILGDALVFAYRPGSPQKPELEQGLIMVHARDAKLLAQLVGRLHEIQKNAGEIKETKAKSYRGRSYQEVVSIKETTFYYLKGPILAVTSQESMMRETLERDELAPVDAEPAIAGQLRQQGIKQALAALWINPRAFESALEHKIAMSAGAQTVALKAMLRYWRAIDGFSVACNIEEQLEFQIAMRANASRLPEPAQRLFASAVGSSSLWSAFPERAIVTVAGRLDLSAAMDLLGDFLDGDARKGIRGMVEQNVGAVLGKDVARDLLELLPTLGPEWGLSIAAPDPKEISWFPQVTAAVRVPNRLRGKERVLLDALNALATLVVFSHNQGKPGALSLRSLIQDGIEIKYIATDEEYAAGLQPAYALRLGYLVLASSPEVLRRFSADSRPGAQPEESYLLRLSVRELLTFFEGRRDALVQHLATRNQLTKDEAASGLDTLCNLARLVDRVEIVHRPIPAGFAVTVRITMSRPLK